MQSSKPVFDEDVTECLKMCSAVFFGATPIHQPLYYYKYFYPEHPPLPICAACATTCHELDSDCETPWEEKEALAQPFVCMCRCNVHRECYWKFDVDDGRVDGLYKSEVFLSALKEKWAKESTIYQMLLLQHANSLDAEKRKMYQTELTESIKRDVAHYKQFEDDRALRAARAVIPLQTFKSNIKANFTQEAVLRELMRWFKHEFFSWVNTLPCKNCGNEKTTHGGRGVASPEDVAYGATVVELHSCTSCGHNTRFPRYNSAVKLLSTRRGRCGEWTTCFTLCCRALGFDARYVHDHTDHVWTEVYLFDKSRWVHVDPAEEALDNPLMYETGWGKKLNYIFAVSAEEVVDVIKRYTRKNIELGEMAETRNWVSEEFLRRLVASEDDRLRGGLLTERRNIVVDRRAREKVELEGYLLDESEKQQRAAEAQGGRTTGSEEWRQGRGEMGK